MRLRKINLAGFKSFVDPTTIAFPGELTGIVGPNGCGKSNVIDAVRWVMGEMSAKHLRGDSMADVVFNGSNTRKPVGQASVELVFDNSDGRVGGRYANYSEIALKRQVGREGKSAYFLNGTRCRRRDITDLFLGTGLGPHSYAIIEQGMISRLIEAKPDELREFIEEAAGVSKYKERRRETENRIRHTQENLGRLNDLREEVDKQLHHLKRQANAAERFKKLKQEERLVRGELLALRWRKLEAQASQDDLRLAQQETALEAATAEQRGIEARLEKQRVAQSTATDGFNAIYRGVLDAGADIARTEEEIQHLRSGREQLKNDLEREGHLLRESRDHLTKDEQACVTLSAAVREQEPELRHLEDQIAKARDAFERSEEAMHEWQTQWEAFSHEAAEPARAAQGERTRIEHLEQSVNHLAQQIARSEQELIGLESNRLRDEITQLHADIGDMKLVQSGAQDALEHSQSSIRQQREHANRLATDLHATRERLQESRGQLASLRALQDDALGKSPGVIMEWLHARGLDSLPRLAQKLEVDSGWELAVEGVLGHFIEAVCTTDINTLTNELESLEEGAITLLDTSTEGATPDGDERIAPMLKDCVRAPWSLGSLLDGIYLANSLPEALALRARCGPRQSVVTQSGDWIGGNWVRAARRRDGQPTVFARERQVKRLSVEHQRHESTIEALESDLAQARSELSNTEAEFTRLQSEMTERHDDYATLRARLERKGAELKQHESRSSDVKNVLTELSARFEEQQREVAIARHRLQGLLEEMERLEDERYEWGRTRDAHRSSLESSRARWQTLRDNAYEVGVRVESMRTQLGALEQSRARMREQVARLEARCQELSESLSEADVPIRECETALQERLTHHGQLQSELEVARARAEELDSELQALEKTRHEREQQVNAERELLETYRLESREIHTRSQSLEEQVADSGHELNVLLEGLADDAFEDAWIERLEGIERRVSRLGPINLAAIEEFTEQQKRKEYLDAQYDDLSEALATLASAIQKIDKETRARFKQTFDQINAVFGTVFPRLFGGGNCHLELTGTDLLCTGIAVMARPPGKRISTIHLLSGGEKALTAVALVFAIFELNPAPFCLLDEVDAPLDDANVGRFCGLVQEMVDRVQLIVVTHNKTTMEIAEQLVGVTMNEPGVSRLVAVDMDAAVQMVAQ